MKNAKSFMTYHKWKYLQEWTALSHKGYIKENFKSIKVEYIIFKYRAISYISIYIYIKSSENYGNSNLSTTILYCLKIKIGCLVL